MKASFIGLGRMGAPMAKRILASGRKLTVYNRSPEKSKPLAEAGAAVAKSADAAFKGAGLVFTMVSNDDALSSLATPSRVGAMAPGGAHVSLSTISAELSEAMTNQHASLGASFLGCPVFGRPQAAADGTLAVCLAGAPEAKAAARPWLEAIGRVHDLGDRPVGANAVKLAGNLMIATTIEMLAESFSLVEKHGVDPEAFFQLVSTTNFSAPAVKIYGRLLLDAAYEPAGFAAALAAKDVGLVRAAARQSRTPMPLASLLEDRLLRILARGWGKMDWSVIGLDQRRDAGLADPDGE
jgi:3-hydroxyisobutyrate dehydrogenase-like beta-hydroxyacid dehydrogenase